MIYKIIAILMMGFLSACSSNGITPETMAAMFEKLPTPSAEDNKVVITGYTCPATATDCSISIPLPGGNGPSEALQLAQTYLNYEASQPGVYEWTNMFLGGALDVANIWDRTQSRKYNFKTQQAQFEWNAKSNEQMYKAFQGMANGQAEANQNIAIKGFESVESLANANGQSFQALFDSQNELISNIFSSLPDGGDINNYEYNDAFNQYDGSFNPSTSHQDLQPIDWGGLTLFAEAFQQSTAEAIPEPDQP